MLQAEDHHSRRTCRYDCEYGLTYFDALFPPRAALLMLLVLLLGAFLYLYADDLADGTGGLTPLLTIADGFAAAGLVYACACMYPPPPMGTL